MLLCGHMSDRPRQLVIQTIAMPKDTMRMATSSEVGDVTNGRQRDSRAKTAQARVVTAAMEGMSFLEPVRVGDTVSFCASGENRRTSMTIPVEVWVTRHMTAKSAASAWPFLRGRGR